MQDARQDIHGMRCAGRGLREAAGRWGDARRGPQGLARGPRGWTATLGGLAVLSALAGTAWGVAATQPAAETVIRLQAAAVVTGEQVTLADVAELTGEAALLAASWSVAAAPRPGEAGSVDIQHLQSVLSRRGVNLSNWVFRGASRCVVSRPAGRTLPRRHADLAPAGASPAAARPADDPSPEPSMQPPAVTQSPDIIPGTFEAAIYDYLSGRLSGVDGQLTVRFSPATDRLLALSAPDYAFHVTGRSDRLLGIVPLEVAVRERGRPVQVVQVVCEAAVRKTVVVAGRNINRGELLQQADLTTEARTFERPDEIGLADFSPLLGQRARRMLRQGDVLSQRDVEAVPLVSRNDLVTVSVRRGGLLITAAARAASSGCLGETVTLRSEISKQTFSGVVTGMKTVDLVDTRAVGGLAAAGGAR